MKYLGNYVTSNLTNNEHLTNRIRLTVTAMLKLNEAGYDESLDAFAAIQLYKTYGRPTLLYGVESLNFNTKQTDRLTSCETSIVKRILKLAPFHHSDLLLDALKLNKMSEKLQSIKSAFMIRLMRSFTRELLKCYNGVPHRLSILHPIMEYTSNSSLTRHLTIKKITEFAEFAHDIRNAKVQQ